ncbi:hypothetical protein IJG72_03560 [bacterium]|nr:hypothetical protein [bacterium]
MPEKMSDFEIKQPIRTVEINSLKIGNDKSFRFLSENSNSSKTLYALELDIFNPELSNPVVKEYFSKANSNPQQIIELAQKTSCDILGLKFNIDEDLGQINQAKNLLKSLLPFIKKPLMIRGINKTDIDSVLLPELISVLDRECIIAFASEKTYKNIVPSVIKGNHVLVLRTPIDINLAKEMNILTTEMGLSPDKILIDPDMGGLGYGLEYGYSIMERIKLAGFDGDSMLNMPIIAFAGEETLKTKEAKTEEISSSWGDLNHRAIMLEITAGSAISAAGANIVVLNHPKSIETLKGLD